MLYRTVEIVANEFVVAKVAKANRGFWCMFNAIFKQCRAIFPNVGLFNGEQ